LGGAWKVDSEYIESIISPQGDITRMELQFMAKKVFLVVSSDTKN
jgi:hypothetical protein